MKKIALFLIFVIAISFTGCADKVVDTNKVAEPSGINEDGIGSVIPLTDEEILFVLDQTTQSWLKMSKEEKDELVVYIGRWWEDCEGRIVEDYDDMVNVIDHQMEQYYRNNVNETLFDVVCDIYGVDKTLYVK